MADVTAQPKPNGADTSDAALKSTLASMVPGAIQAQKQQVSDAQQQVKQAQADLSQGTENYEDTENALQGQYDAALQHANDVAQRQRGITLDITKGIWKFAPIAIAFGLLASKETGGNIASGLSVMMQGLAGYANGRYQQYKDAYGQWQDSLKSAQDEVKEISDRAKEIMGDQKVDLQTRIKQLQLATTNYQHLNQAALTNDPAKIVKAIADLDRAHAAFVKAARGPMGKANPNISGDLMKTAGAEVDKLYPAPPILGADGKPIPQEQLTSNVVQIAQGNSPGYYAWSQKQKTLSRQLAQAAQPFVADGMTNSEAIRTVIGDWTKRGLLPKSMPSDFDMQPQRRASQPENVSIGGKSYATSDIQAYAARTGKTYQQVIDLLKAKAGH
jgi:uncharacterized phage infection (PIP) family protein YhgE